MTIIWVPATILVMRMKVGCADKQQFMKITTWSLENNLLRSLLLLILGLISICLMRMGIVVESGYDNFPGIVIDELVDNDGLPSSSSRGGDGANRKKLSRVGRELETRNLSLRIWWNGVFKGFCLVIFLPFLFFLFDTH